MPPTAGRDRAVSLALLGLALVLPFAAALWHDPGRSAVATSDADLIFVSQALLVAGGHAQTYTDHTGYLYIQALAGWFRALHAVGLLSAGSLRDMPHDAAFLPAFADLVVAGRWFTAVLASVTVGKKPAAAQSG